MSGSGSSSAFDGLAVMPASYEDLLQKPGKGKDDGDDDDDDDNEKPTQQAPGKEGGKQGKPSKDNKGNDLSGLEIKINKAERAWDTADTKIELATKATLDKMESLHCLGTFLNFFTIGSPRIRQYILVAWGYVFRAKTYDVNVPNRRPTRVPNCNPEHVSISAQALLDY